MVKCHQDTENFILQLSRYDLSPEIFYWNIGCQLSIILNFGKFSIQTLKTFCNLDGES